MFGNIRGNVVKGPILARLLVHVFWVLQSAICSEVSILNAACLTHGERGREAWLGGVRQYTWCWLELSALASALFQHALAGDKSHRSTLGLTAMRARSKVAPVPWVPIGPVRGQQGGADRGMGSSLPCALSSGMGSSSTSLPRKGQWFHGPSSLWENEQSASLDI